MESPANMIFGFTVPEKAENSEKTEHLTYNLSLVAPNDVCMTFAVYVVPRSSQQLPGHWFLVQLSHPFEIPQPQCPSPPQTTPFLLHPHQDNRLLHIF